MYFVLLSDDGFLTNSRKALLMLLRVLELLQVLAAPFLSGAVPPAARHWCRRDAQSRGATVLQDKHQGIRTQHHSWCLSWSSSEVACE